MIGGDGGMKTGFYEFSQNNSGGVFIVDDVLCHRMFIEATDKHDANRIAERLGVYFDGRGSHHDCPCCGDRWSRADDWDKVDMANIIDDGYVVSFYTETNIKEDALNEWANQYGKYIVLEKPKFTKTDGLCRCEGRISFRSFEEYVQFLADEYGWTTPDCRIFYKNGTKTDVFSKNVP
ncbi:MAG: hypothetical protein BV459_00520 [Thermoplasmata archaeon M11B2D]|nr:MAG: hypothetical protein BV459_00520 [Thermoplasmata archaeon M11B2D]